MKSKTIALILCASMLLRALTACGSDPTGQENADGASVTSDGASGTENEAGSETPAETESIFVKDDLPHDLTYGGRSAYIRIGDYAGAYSVDMVSEGLTGERYNDAIFNMIRTVEERLDVRLEYAVEPYVFSELAAFQSSVIADIMAQSETFDVLFDAQNYSGQMESGTYFVNLRDTKYIDTDKPWYNRTIVENMPSDYIWFLSGQFSVGNIKNTFGIYLNDDLFRALGHTEDLYAIVDSGQWTLDRMKEIISGSYADLDGDGQRSVNDRYGLTFGDANKYLGFLPSNEGRVFSRTADGYAYEYDSERMNDIITRMCALTNENPDVLPGLPNTDTPEWMTSMGGGNFASNAFINGNAVFQAGLLADSSVLIGMIPFSYGLVPYPKYDEAQKDYHIMLQRSCYTMIPVSAPDSDFSSAVIEAISSETYRSLIPEYFEISLKTRYAADSDMARMFDLIAQGIVYDPGEIFAGQLNYPTAQFRETIRENDVNWASRSASLKKTLVKSMDKIYENMNNR